MKEKNAQTNPAIICESTCYWITQYLQRNLEQRTNNIIQKIPIFHKFHILFMENQTILRKKFKREKVSFLTLHCSTIINFNYKITLQSQNEIISYGKNVERKESERPKKHSTNHSLSRFRLRWRGVGGPSGELGLIFLRQQKHFNFVQMSLRCSALFLLFFLLFKFFILLLLPDELEYFSFDHNVEQVRKRQCRNNKRDPEVHAHQTVTADFVTRLRTSENYKKTLEK